jgi:hypothetical protein
MFDKKMVSIKTDIPYSISIKEYLNLGRVTEVTAKDILEDVIKFMLDNEKVFQIN